MHVVGDLELVVLGRFSRIEIVPAPAQVGDEVDDLHVGFEAATPVSGAAETAVAAVVAMRILTCSDPHAAGAQLHWLVSVSRRRGLAVTASNIGWSRHISDALHSAQLCSLSPFLTPSDQLRYRSAAARPTAPDASTDRTRHVPAMLWPNAAFFFAAPAVGIEQLRTALSAAVCLVSARRTLPQVIASLGSATTAPAVSRVLQALHADHRWPAMLAALTGLAETLDSGTCPIDYARRRALPFEEFLPDLQWREVCWDTATPTGRALRVRLVRCWMFERVIGSPVRDCCHALDTAEFRSKVKTLPLTLTPATVARLDHAATEFLQQHNVYDEPLRWQPNSGLFSACGLRSPTGDLTMILPASQRQAHRHDRYCRAGRCTAGVPPLPHRRVRPVACATAINTRFRRAPLWDGRYLAR